MLNDAQHAKLKRLLTTALDSENWRETAQAIEDAAAIVGARCNTKFVNADLMKIGPMPRFSPEALSQVMANQEIQAIEKYGVNYYAGPKPKGR